MTDTGGLFIDAITILTSDNTMLFSCSSATQKSACLRFVTMRGDALIDVSGGTRDWRPAKSYIENIA